MTISVITNGDNKFKIGSLYACVDNLGKNQQAFQKYQVSLLH
jgi:hypothetical protein